MVLLWWVQERVTAVWETSCQHQAPIHRAGQHCFFLLLLYFCTACMVVPSCVCSQLYPKHCTNSRSIQHKGFGKICLLWMTLQTWCAPFFFIIIFFFYDVVHVPNSWAILLGLKWHIIAPAPVLNQFLLCFLVTVYFFLVWNCGWILFCLPYKNPQWLG